MLGKDSVHVVTMAEVTHRYALRVLELVAGNRSRAAALLGVERRTLYRRLARYERAKR